MDNRLLVTIKEVGVRILVCLIDIIAVAGLSWIANRLIEIGLVGGFMDIPLVMLQILVGFLLLGLSVLFFVLIVWCVQEVIEEFGRW